LEFEAKGFVGVERGGLPDGWWWSPRHG
jgi:hypothetical protein